MNFKNYQMIPPTLPLQPVIRLNIKLNSQPEEQREKPRAVPTKACWQTPCLERSFLLSKLIKGKKLVPTSETMGPINIGKKKLCFFEDSEE